MTKKVVEGFDEWEKENEMVKWSHIIPFRIIIQIEKM